MHDISKRTSPKVESLYVKTFNSIFGPEYGIRQVFLMGRQMAPVGIGGETPSSFRLSREFLPR
jgi:hypothetical protein